MEAQHNNCSQSSKSLYISSSGGGGGTGGQAHSNLLLNLINKFSQNTFGNGINVVTASPCGPTT